MKYFIIISLLFISEISLSQSSLNIFCKDFTFQKKKWDLGVSLRNTFEVAVSNPKFPFKVVEREKMSTILEVLQEEKNLYKDLDIEFNNKLQLAGIDFLVVGDMELNVGSGNYSLYVNFIKLSGDKTLVKLPLMIILTKDQLSDSEERKIIFSKEIEQFSNSFFITNRDTSPFVKIPIFFKELNKRDSIINSLKNEASLNNKTVNNLSNHISDLQNDLTIKGEDIKNLNKSINDIKDYSNIARLNLLGKEIDDGDIVFNNPLSLLMEKILTIKDNNIIFNYQDSTLTHINEVIINNPKFPFGYYAKATYLRYHNNSDWIIYAQKAMEILSITVNIEGHHAHHDDIYAKLKRAGVTIK